MNTALRQFACWRKAPVLFFVAAMLLSAGCGDDPRRMAGTIHVSKNPISASKKSKVPDINEIKAKFKSKDKSR